MATMTELLVRTFMTSNKVFTVRADKKLIYANEIMKWARIRHVPVVDRQRHLVGMITQRDLMRAMLSTAARRVDTVEQKQHLWTVQIGDVMQGCDKLHVTSPDTPIQEAAALMRKHKIGALPVVEDKRLVGILTEYDLLKIVEDL